MESLTPLKRSTGAENPLGHEICPDRIHDCNVKGCGFLQRASEREGYFDQSEYLGSTNYACETRLLNKGVHWTSVLTRSHVSVRKHLVDRAEGCGDCGVRGKILEPYG